MNKTFEPFAIGETNVLGYTFWMHANSAGLARTSFEPIASPPKDDDETENPELQELATLHLEAAKSAALQFLDRDFESVGSTLRSAVSRSYGFLGESQDAIDSVVPGTTISYKELATLANRPKAYRAAATGCAKNPIPLFRPCHRVIKSDGTIGGFAFSLDIKAAMIKHEQRR